MSGPGTNTIERWKARSGTHRLLCAASLLVTAAPIVMAQSGGGYDLRWNTQDAGGSSASGASGYTLSGTAAQPDVNADGSTSGSGFVLRGGFWPGLHAGTDTIFGSGFEAKP